MDSAIDPFEINWGYFEYRGEDGWVHMSCALWIPEVGIGNVEKMEPITRIETIPVRLCSEFDAMLF